jgi:DNA-3-methyladenine glycosylase
VLPQSFYAQDALSLARALIGCELVCTTPAGIAAGIIVETEAYRQDDEASHSFRGQTPRNAAMFGPAGHAYVYFTYGMHYCFNVVGGTTGQAEAVLIRALEPTEGIELMTQRRGVAKLTNLCSGPAKLVQALGITPSDNAASLLTKHLHLRASGTSYEVATGPRIGIRRATEKPWRFYVPQNSFVSKGLFNLRSLQ